MFINRTNTEDLTMLRLFVDKLEEQMSEKGIKFFDYGVSVEELGSIVSDPDWVIDKTPTVKPIEGKVGPIKRIVLRYHSKGLFYNKHSFDGPPALDDGIYTASTLSVEWDHFTNLFTIYVGNELYEKELVKQGQTPTLKRMSRSNSRHAHISLDFRFENRREIQLIKVRLSKLYAKLKRDKLLEQESFNRKQLTDIALEAFPDLLDSLILGG
jgi:hypothetical protein